MRVSVKIGDQAPDVRTTGGYVKRPGADGVERHESYGTMGTEMLENQIPKIAGKDPSRVPQSPTKMAGNKRHPDTQISINDAEVPMLLEGRNIAHAMMANAKMTADPKKAEPWHVELEFHGNDGPCGIDEAKGCKGRLATASETIFQDFRRKAPGGSTFTATSVYARYQETNRGGEQRIDTKYGYAQSDPQMTYGADNPQSKCTRFGMMKSLSPLRVRRSAPRSRSRLWRLANNKLYARPGLRSVAPKPKGARFRNAEIESENTRTGGGRSPNPP